MYFICLLSIEKAVEKVVYGKLEEGICILSQLKSECTVTHID